MELYDVVTFVHIATLLAAISLAGYLHATEWQFRNATTLSELRLLFGPQKWGVLFAPIIGLLLFEGMWLLKLSDDQAQKFDFGDGWVWTAIVALAVLFACGAGIMGPHGERTGKALAGLGDGPVTPEARELVADKVTWTVGHWNTGLAVAVACNMVNKPDAPVAILVLVVGSAIGVAIGLIGRKRALA
jgi:hypothetical protein